MRFISLMSGTSVDAIDAACVEVSGSPGNFKIVLAGYEEVQWPDAARNAIFNTFSANVNLAMLTALNTAIGDYFADAAIHVAAKTGWDLRSVSAVASHGQTVWHQPELIFIGSKGYTGTLQLGEPSVIALRTGCDVVSDFRSADMAVGGQGAPLVPFADYALFSDRSETRAVQNLGGMANVTYLPAGGALSETIAFDTGPGNVLIDALSNTLSDGLLRMDSGGRMAERGNICGDLLEECLNHSYFSQSPPRSTGRECFGREYAEHLADRARARRLSNDDLLATITALTARSIINAYKQYLIPRGNIDTVILGGGGVKNSFLVSLLRDGLKGMRLKTHADYGIDNDAKEAIAFAVLAHETLHHRPGNVPSATGARSHAILGKITYATKSDT